MNIVFILFLSIT